MSEFLNWIDRHGLTLAMFGAAGGWGLQKFAIIAAIFSSLTSGALALFTIYLKLKKKDK